MDVSPTIHTPHPLCVRHEDQSPWNPTVTHLRVLSGVVGRGGFDALDARDAPSFLLLFCFNSNSFLLLLVWHLLLLAWHLSLVA